MARIELDVGESIVVTFKGTDGEITVAFADKDIRILTGCDANVATQLQALGGITVHADMRDTSGREGVVYHEPLGELDDGFKVPVVEHNEPTEHQKHLESVKKFIADGDA